MKAKFLILILSISVICGNALAESLCESYGECVLYGDYYNARSQHEFAINCYDSAFEYVDEAEEVDYHLLHLKRGYSYYYNGKFYEAQDDFIAAYEYAQDEQEEFSASIALGNINAVFADYDAAIEEFSVVIENASGEEVLKYAYNNLADVYRLIFEYEKAEELFLKALEIDPEFIYPYSGLAKIYIYHQDWEKAAEYMEEVVSYKEGDLFKAIFEINAYEVILKRVERDNELPTAGFFIDKGDLRYDKEKFKNAAMFYLIAAMLEPDNSNAIYNLALTYEECYEDALAVVSYFHYIKLVPEDKIDVLENIQYLLE